MKTLELNAVITGIRAKVDGSLGVTIGTPELTPEEKAEVMRLQGVNTLMIIRPLDEPNAPKYKINKELEQKTPSQRLRNVLYVLWEQSGDRREFNEYYRVGMEKIINSVKERLE